MRQNGSAMEAGLVYTSKQLRDKLNLDKESGCDQIRRIMRRLQTEGKVIIGEEQHGERKECTFSLSA